MNSKADIKKHFDNIAESYDYWKQKNSYYYFLVKGFFKKNIPAGSSVVEFGCATAEILSCCKPKRGLGIDISDRLTELAKNKYPEYEFKIEDAENFSSTEKFDYCIMSDLLDHLTDIPAAIECAYNALNPQGKLLITTINPLWNPVFGILENLQLKMPEGPHCFVPNRFIEFICQIKGFKIVSIRALIFIPKKVPLLSNFLNNIMPNLPIAYRFCWVQALIAQKVALSRKDLSYSIIIPVFNEEKNIRECIERVPKSDKGYEIIVIDDGSNDATPLILEDLQKQIRNLNIITFPKNMGKASAIKKGITSAKKDVIIILDADMSVAPEDTLLFLEPMERGLADFINGTRLIYNMEKKAMEQIKRIANFSLAVFFSFIIKFRITDALCGSKAFFRKDFQDLDTSGERWGDLELLWTAKRKGLRIKEIPVRYYKRKFGQSKMRFCLDGLKFMSYALRVAIKEIFQR